MPTDDQIAANLNAVGGLRDQLDELERRIPSITTEKNNLDRNIKDAKDGFDTVKRRLDDDLRQKIQELKSQEESYRQDHDAKLKIEENKLNRVKVEAEAEKKKRDAELNEIQRKISVINSELNA